MQKKLFIVVLLLIATYLLINGIRFTQNTFFKNTKFNIERPASIYIDQTKDFDDLLRQLIYNANIEDIELFKMLAESKNYPKNLRTGHYVIETDDTAKDLLKKLTQGLQNPVKVTFNNIRLKEDLAEVISEQMMFEKDSLTNLLTDSIFCTNLGFTKESIISIFIPNTYEFYWDTSPKRFMERMNREYDKFWTSERMEKASNLNLTRQEVATLASIVEEECTYPDEYPIVAGLYLNRLRRGQPLQADPTLKFVVGDFSLRRILNSHMNVDSKYNTYKYAGLPPGPIRMPSIKGIEAVLNPSMHNYYFMCAKDDFSGRHNFATTLSQHNINAAKYHAALNQRKIFN